MAKEVVLRLTSDQSLYQNSETEKKKPIVLSKKLSLFLFVNSVTYSKVWMDDLNITANLIVPNPWRNE